LFKELDNQWIHIYTKHFIIGANQLDDFMQRIRPQLDVYLVSSENEHCAANSIKPPKNVKVVLFRDPLPCSVKQKKEVGPWWFKIIPAQGVEIMSPSVTLQSVKVVPSQYEMTDLDKGESGY